MRLKPLSPDKVIKILGRFGFQKIRQRGSHIILQHIDGRVTVIPFHKNEEIGRGLLRRIIREVEIDREDFLKMIEKV